MRITLSAAVTADGYLDDNSSERLIVSTPEDWTEVRRLRAEHDAILVGAETLRRDDPALLIRDESRRASRRAQGLRPDIAKVGVTRSGNRLSPAMRFFTEGDAERYVFSETPIPALEGAAEVIIADEPITAAWIVTELEKRGIESLFVEGGAQILRLFLNEGEADTLRLAVNPSLRIGAERGGAAFEFTPPANTPVVREFPGGMQVATYRLRKAEFSEAEDLKFLRQAIEASRRCTPSTTSYSVGAVIVARDGSIFTGYTHETSPTHHAEQEAIAKALAAGAALRGATIYSSMEPCSTRKSEPESCSALIVRLGFARAVFALYEPDCFVRCRGALNMRLAGLDVRCYPALAEEVRAVNGHLWR